MVTTRARPARQDTAGPPLRRLGFLLVRRRRLVLALALVLLIGAGVLAAGRPPGCRWPGSRRPDRSRTGRRPSWRNGSAPAAPT